MKNKIEFLKGDVITLVQDVVSMDDLLAGIEEPETHEHYTTGEFVEYCTFKNELEAITIKMPAGHEISMALKAIKRIEVGL